MRMWMIVSVVESMVRAMPESTPWLEAVMAESTSISISMGTAESSVWFMDMCEVVAISTTVEVVEVGLSVSTVSE